MKHPISREPQKNGLPTLHHPHVKITDFPIRRSQSPNPIEPYGLFSVPLSILTGKLLYLALLFLFYPVYTTAQILHGKAPSQVLIFNQGKEDSDSTLTQRVIDQYYASLENGFRQTGLPHFLMADKSQRMIFGIGGNVTLRASYDFRGIADDLDFITADIPVPNGPKNDQQLLLDPSTSGLFFRIIARTDKLGPIVGYVTTDFRGYNNTLLYFREAHVSVAGFLFGRNYTTFCDRTATPGLVDWQGPNIYPAVYRAMIRYTYTAKRHWSFAVAAEMPKVTVTAPDDIELIPQRMPDIPVYLQYSWNEGRGYIRATGLFRNMIYYNNTTERRLNEFGWGTQLSGSFQLGNKWKLYYQGIYGKGIAAHIQDISSDGFDLVADPRNTERLQTLPLAGWLGGFMYTFNPKWAITGVYSGVKLFPRNDYFQEDLYLLSHYVSTNVFYHLTDNFQFGLSYMYGTRQNQNRELGRANRIQLVAQYNF